MKWVDIYYSLYDSKYVFDYFGIKVRLENHFEPNKQ